MSLYENVKKEINKKFNSHIEAANYHLNMASAHIFEETEGRDINDVQEKINEIIKLIN